MYTNERVHERELVFVVMFVFVFVFLIASVLVCSCVCVRECEFSCWNIRPYFYGMCVCVYFVRGRRCTS